MNTELESLYTEVSSMAPWLTTNFQGKTKHRRLVNFMVNNPIDLLSKDAQYKINHCFNFIGVNEESLQVLLEEIKQIFRYNSNREDDHLPSITTSLNKGLSLPQTTTQFYWRELKAFKVLQFQGLISLQTGELVDFHNYVDYFPSGKFYIKDKVTQFDKEGMTTMYWIGLWDDGPIEE